jgi:Leucine-rich repeat (LRR) protein
MPEKSDPLAEAERRIAQAGRSGAVELDLSGLGLTVVPDSVARLTNLERLWLFKNRLTVIPDSLAELVNLEALSLDGNQIRAIPGFLAGMSNLGFSRSPTTNSRRSPTPSLASIGFLTST